MTIRLHELTFLKSTVIETADAIRGQRSSEMLSDEDVKCADVTRRVKESIIAS